MKAGAIVFRKEMREILRDRRTLIAIGLAALATPLVLFVISQVSTRTVAQAYTVGYTGTKGLTFSGASNSPNATVPTVHDNGTTSVAFGTSTPITFASGVASQTSSALLATFYKAVTTQNIVPTKAIKPASQPIQKARRGWAPAIAKWSGTKTIQARAPTSKSGKQRG